MKHFINYGNDFTHKKTKTWILVDMFDLQQFSLLMVSCVAELSRMIQISSICGSNFTENAKDQNPVLRDKYLCDYKINHPW